MTILSFIKGAKEKGYEAIKASCASPGIVYWVDHYYAEEGGAFARMTISKTKDGHFEAQLSKLLIQDISKNVTKLKLGTFGHYFEAKDKIEQQITLLEQEGWDFLEDGVLELVDLLSEIEPLLKEVASLVPLKVNEAADIFGNGYIRGVKVTGGIRCLVVMDSFKNIWVRPSNQSGGVKWELASSVVKNAFERFAGVDGTRGVAVEVVIEDCKVTIIDVLFMHNKWIWGDEHFSRLSSLDNYTKHNKIFCDIHLPVRVSVGGLRNLFFGAIKGVVIQKGAARYVVGLEVSKIYFSAAWKKVYSIQDETNMSRLGEIDGRFLPDLSYLTFICCGEGSKGFLS